MSILTSFRQFSWARGLETQINGKQLSDVNLATDDATVALRTISQDAYAVATLISTFNRDVVLPNFSNLQTAPNNFLANLRTTIDMLSGTVKNTNENNWADVVYTYRFLRGFAFVPAEGEYFALYDHIKNHPLPLSYKELYLRAVTTIPFPSRVATDLFFQTALYLPNAPASVQQPFYPISSDLVANVFSSYADTSANPPVDSSGSPASHNDTLSALSVTRTPDGKFVMKGQILSNFLDGVTLVGSNIVNNATATQFLAHALFTDRLVGCSVIVDASKCAKLASSPGSDVSFMYRSLPPFGAPSTTFYGMMVTKVLNFKFVEDYDNVGTNIQTIQFAFEVVDNPVNASAPKMVDYVVNDPTIDAPVMVSADTAIRLRFALTLANFFKMAA
eukprot:gene19577-26261_t